MCHNIKIRVAALAIAKWIGICHQVTEGAVGLDQLLNASGLADLIIFRELEVNGPTNWLIRDAKSGEDLIVEVLSAEHDLVDTTQEVTRLRALNNAMIVGACKGNDLRDRKIGESLFTRTLELCWVIHRSNAKDQTLSFNQARNGVNCSKGSRVGE